MPDTVAINISEDMRRLAEAVVRKYAEHQEKYKTIAGATLVKKSDEFRDFMAAVAAANPHISELQDPEARNYVVEVGDLPEVAEALGALMQEVARTLRNTDQRMPRTMPSLFTYGLQPRGTPRTL